MIAADVTDAAAAAATAVAPATDLRVRSSRTEPGRLSTEPGRLSTELAWLSTEAAVRPSAEAAGLAMEPAVRLSAEAAGLARRRPKRLRPGSRVAVVAPSGRNDADLVAAGCAVLTGWGLEVEVAPHALASHPDLSYLAGNDTGRAADLQQAWLDPRIEAVVCARGGYGAQRIADQLDWTAMAEVPPKIFTGFSDITALHEAFALRLGVTTLHAPNIGAASFVQFPEAQESLRRALFEPDRLVLSPGDTHCLVSGRSAGLTAGGNLSLLVAGLGTADSRQPATSGRTQPAASAGSQPAASAGGQPAVSGGGFAGCILLLEDVREECYRLDRMLTQLLRSGALDGVAGVALGTWTECGEPEAVRQVMQDRLGGLGVPVVWGMGFGHIAPQPTVPLGVPAELDADNGTLTFLEPAVA
ncbi:MAG TPA: LD-carboxypeptidase [Streptosporangiaceae bacterium]|nr:LD-carboxypeptidase [Streptosporangiaceae bacterium]